MMRARERKRGGEEHREGEGGGRATGEEGRSTEREKERGEQPADRAGSRDEESREAGEQGRGRVSRREGARARGYPASVPSLPNLPPVLASLLQTLTVEAARQGSGRGHVPASLAFAL